MDVQCGVGTLAVNRQHTLQGIERVGGTADIESIPARPSIQRRAVGQGSSGQNVKSVPAVAAVDGQRSYAGAIIDGGGVAQSGQLGTGQRGGAGRTIAAIVYHQAG